MAITAVSTALRAQPILPSVVPQAGNLAPRLLPKMIKKALSYLSPQDRASFRKTCRSAGFHILPVIEQAYMDGTMHWQQLQNLNTLPRLRESFRIVHADLTGFDGDERAWLALVEKCMHFSFRSYAIRGAHFTNNHLEYICTEREDRLTRLHIDSCPELTELFCLTYSSNIQDFQLRDCSRISFEHYAQMICMVDRRYACQSLTRLDLSNNYVGEMDLRVFDYFPRLQSINLSGVYIDNVSTQLSSDDIRRHTIDNPRLPLLNEVIFPDGSIWRRPGAAARAAASSSSSSSTSSSSTSSSSSSSLLLTPAPLMPRELMHPRAAAPAAVSSSSSSSTSSSSTTSSSSSSFLLTPTPLMPRELMHLAAAAPTAVSSSSSSSSSSSLPAPTPPLPREPSGVKRNREGNHVPQLSPTPKKAKTG